MYTSLGILASNELYFSTTFYTVIYGQGKLCIETVELIPILTVL